MNSPATNDTGRILGAIFGGCIAAIAAGLALLPLMYLIFDNFFELHFGRAPDGVWVNTLVIIVSCLAWLFVSLYAGGYVGARIARQNEYTIAWTILSIAVLIFIVYGSKEGLPRFVEMLVITGVAILGVLAGCHSGIEFKHRKAKQVTQAGK